LAAKAPAKRPPAALVPALAPQVALGVPDALGDQPALELRDRGEHGHDQFRDPVARAVVAKVEEPQADPAALEVGDRLQGVERAAERAVHLGRDHHVARLHRAQQPGALRPAGERGRARDARIDIDVPRCQPFSVQRASILRCCSSSEMPESRC
jgi:hypothetical protein